jgi:thiol-disulfide isomerase/thioredoxin
VGARRKQIATAAIVLAGGLAVILWSTHRPASENSQSPVETSDALRRDIYPDGSRAASDLANALSQAGRENKRVLIDFGGNWCPDCLVLDIYMHEPSNLKVLQANFVLVYVNIGRYDQNQELAARFGIPLEKGVPALAVLSPSGDVLYSQRNGEFEKMSRIDPASVNSFLNAWKPQS